MITELLKRIKILPLALTIAAGLLAGDSITNKDREACAQALPTGCAVGGSASIAQGSFNEANFDLTNASVNASGNMELDTGSDVLDVNSIVIPFDQEVSAVFLLEGAGYMSSLGWFLKGEAESKLGGPISGTLNFADLVSAGVTLNYLFRSVEDDQETSGCCGGGDGVLDSIYDSSDSLLWSGSTGSLTEAQLNGWGFMTNGSSYGQFGYSEVDPSEMRKTLGTLSAGTEVVFFLHADDDISGKTFYSKDGWSADTWNPSDSDRDNANLVFDLSIPAPEQGGPAATKDFGTTPTTVTQGFIPTAARDRLGNPDGKITVPTNGFFNVQMSGTRTKTVSAGSKYNHFMVASPPNDPFKWIIGVEDLIGGGDADFNDMVFMIERKTGGVAQLKSTQALSPSDADAYITSVTFNVNDKMPCSGDTYIRYYLSIDNGGTWVEAADWDTIKTPDENGSDVTTWSYGSPEETFREITINFSEIGLTGRELIWKAEMVSEDDTCKPEIISVGIEFSAAKNAEFSRSSPSILANVIYSAGFETPDAAWTETDLRGHFTSTRLYDPENPGGGYNIVENWDAGTVLTAANPDNRNVLIPDISTFNVTNEVIGTGDGTTTTFTGTFAHNPVVHSTISITDGVETFVDSRTTVLEGSLTGTGTINRYTGEYSVTFNTAPLDGSSIRVDYQYYTAQETMQQFTAANISNDMLALDDSSYTDNDGFHYTYDFNGDGSFNESDGDWLVKWTLGYTDGASTKKEWLLGAIDHSTPAVIGAPGLPSWYYGEAVTDDYRDGFDQFRCEQRDRKTMAYVGSRSGMMHAFYAGEYRPYYVDETALDPFKPNECEPANLNNFRGEPGTTETGAINPLTFTDALTGHKIPYYPGNSVSGAKQITINRGYYDWRTRSAADVLADAAAPNYGDGSETYAVIPLNLLGKIKNNKLKGEDRAFVDASPAVAHVRFQNSVSGTPWRTVMISAEGNGGDTVFALDITDPNSPEFLWEFSDPDLFRSRSSPSVGPIGRIQGATGERWVTFFVSGVNSDPTLYPSIYMIDVETGEVIQRIYLNSSGAGIGGTPAAQPAVVDSDGNGYVDRMFIGTDKGFMYKIVLPDRPDAVTTNINVCTFFDAGQPIYASPAVMLRNTISSSGQTEYKVDLFFGTSDSPYQSDDTGETYWFYAVRDTDNKGSCTAGTELWSFRLPAGHRVFSSAFATAGRIYFGTSTADTEDPCAPATQSAIDAGAGTGRMYALDVDTGAVVYQEEVGNVTASPVVEDEHLYIKSGNGELEGRGGGEFQNELQKGGFGSVSVGSWSEVFVD